MGGGWGGGGTSVADTGISGLDAIRQLASAICRSRQLCDCLLTVTVPKHYKKPRFLEPLKAVLTEEGAVNLECKVIGVPQPSLTWYKDGLELKAGDIHRLMSGKDGSCCLGTYTCVANNCMGSVTSSAALLGFEDTEHLDLEQRVLQWIVSVVHEKPSTDYETFIQDGSILSRVMVNIVFNSVPLEQIDDNWGMVSDNLDLFCHHEINKQKNNVMKRCL
mgnify:CR=1 FL=1